MVAVCRHSRRIEVWCSEDACCRVPVVFSVFEKCAERSTQHICRTLMKSDTAKVRG
jgi:hypothetical protein